MSESLHPLERRILQTLASSSSLPFDRLVHASMLDGDQVRRSLEWLSTKGLVQIDRTKASKLEKVMDPPELLLLEEVRKSGSVSLGDLMKKFGPKEFSAAFGRAKAKGWIEVASDPMQTVTQGKQSPVDLTSAMTAVESGMDEHEFEPHYKKEIPDLLKRGIIKRVEQTDTIVTITRTGRTAASLKEESNSIDKLTPELLGSGEWRGKALRPIDVEAKAPVFFPGRRHPVRDFIREVRETYVSMGFTELQGESVNSAFWNFDALFIPQDHPGREMQDTFYLQGLSDRKLARSGLVANVASAHEDGWKTGSKGWRYTWRIEEARRLVLRTHNTVLTVKALSESKEKETRVFAVSKVYRNENLDYKHLAEFHQMDGIMVGEGLNVRNLMGFLTEFYKKLGMKEVKLWPTYFPYTEPSLEVVGYSEAAKGWIELSGSGVFRPEVTEPLGVKVPVLAWGPGIERLMLMRFGLEDMRELYGGDLSWLRSRRNLAGS